MSLEQAANYGLMLGSCSTAFAAAAMYATFNQPLRFQELHLDSNQFIFSFIAHRRYAIDAVPVFKMALARVQKETQVREVPLFLSHRLSTPSFDSC
jgi:hypothetical protein